MNKEKLKEMLKGYPAIIISIIVILIIYVIFVKHKEISLKSNYSSGSWYSTSGDVLIIQNRGLYDNSKLIIAARNGSDSYDTKELVGKMIIPIFWWPDALGFSNYTAYFYYSGKNLKIMFDIVNGFAKVYQDDQLLDTFYKKTLDV